MTKAGACIMAGLPQPRNPNRSIEQVKTTVKWVDHAMMVGESPSGHAVVMDGPAEVGGRNLGIRPMEMLLLGMGGCTMADVLLILRKAQQEVLDCRVEIEATRADSPPQVYTEIHVHFVVTGRGLEDKHVARAIKLSADKYCSASIMLGQTARITHDYELVEA
jgi:putative redox protein